MTLKLPDIFYQKTGLSDRRYLYRNEIAGAFGDLGTFIPLVISMVVISKLNVVPILVCFGLFYIISALIYRLPIPIQPMKAIAALVIVGGVSANILMTSGIVIGIFFLTITMLGLVERCTKFIPKTVVRGIQLGLGLKLLLTSLKLIETPLVIPYALFPGWMLTATCIILALILFKNRKIPSLPLIMIVGSVPAFPHTVIKSASQLMIPTINLPAIAIHYDIAAMMMAFAVLVIPQIPLTLGNSILATESLSRSLFPKNRTVTIKRLGLTVGFMNIISGLIGGIPVCHGAGGLAGHYRFGARTGISLLTIGLMFLLGGIFYGEKLLMLFNMIPLPILGVILLFAVFELLLRVRDVDFKAKKELSVVMLVGIIAALVPYGFAIGIAAGIILAYTFAKIKI